MMGMWRGTCEVKTLTQSHQMEILKKISKTRSVFQISSWRGAWSPLRKKIQCHEAFSNQQKISGRKSLDWMLLSNRFVRTAEGGVSTGGGMDMTKYLSGSYYRLYTLQPPQRQRMRVDRKYHVDRRWCCRVDSEWWCEKKGKRKKDDPMWKMGVSQQAVKTQPRSNGRTKETGNLMTYWWLWNVYVCRLVSMFGEWSKQAIWMWNRFVCVNVTTSLT